MVWEAKRFGIPKGRVSPLYKGHRGALKGIDRVSSFPSFVLFSVIVRTQHQFVGVAAKCFCLPFDTRFILGDRRLENLKAPTEKANLP